MRGAKRSSPVAEPDQSGERKIIHIDMDAFYASVEQRDDASLVGRAMAVSDPRGWGIVATASYEARAQGVKSGMPVGRAKLICPDLRMIKPRLELYQSISAEMGEILSSYTDLVEPVMLDEAYLDVTIAAVGSSATAIAHDIRHRIKADLGLIASAGVSNSKFLAKLASDRSKPNGLLVVPPSRAADFIAELPVDLFHDVGPATAAKLLGLGVRKCTELRDLSLETLVETFGKKGRYLHDMARAIDHRRVQVPAEKRSHGVEISFRSQLTSLEEVRRAFVPVADRVWAKCAEGGVLFARTAIKIRYADFRYFTKSRRLGRAGDSAEALRRAVDDLVDDLPALEDRVRLIGVSVASLLPAGSPPSPPTGEQLDLIQ